MRNLVLFLCFALLAAGIAIGGWMLSRPNPANPEIAKLEAELKEARQKITRLTDTLEQEYAEKRKRELAAAAASKTKTTTVTPASKPDTKDSAAKSKEPAGTTAAVAPSKRAGVKALREMMETPGMKEMIKKQNLVQLEMIYGGLFKKFGLNEEEKENFKMLLGERTGAQTDLGMKVMDESLTPEQRKQLTEDYEKAKKASDERIRTFLGDEGDFKTFQHWEDTQPERMQLEMMGGRSHFQTAGEPLTAEQEEKLIDLMTSVRNAPSKLPDISKPENFWAGEMSDEFIQKQIEKIDADAKTVAQNAAGFLSAIQLQALGKMQEQTRTMTEAGLKMSGAMFKSGK